MKVGFQRTPKFRGAASVAVAAELRDSFEVDVCEFFVRLAVPVSWRRDFRPLDQRDFEPTSVESIQCLSLRGSKFCFPRTQLDDIADRGGGRAGGFL